MCVPAKFTCFRCRPPKNGVPGGRGSPIGFAALNHFPTAVGKLLEAPQKIPFPNNPSVCYADTSPYTGEAREWLRVLPRCGGEAFYSPSNNPSRVIFLSHFLLR